MKRLFIITVMLMFSKSAFSGYKISANEIMQMPPFCKGLSIQNFEDNAKKFKKNIKMPGQHTQHFCHGMKAMLRKKYSTAAQEFRYVQSHSTKKHSLIPATSLYKADALSELGEEKKALSEYNKAIRLRKDYTKAYSKLSDYYLKLQKKEMALKTIKLGLKYSPNSKALKKRLHRLQ